MELYSLWGLRGGHLIYETDDAAAMRALVQELFDLGWAADELSLGLPDRHLALETDELLAWMAQNPSLTP